ncbi:glycosyltransferase [candidate division KSB1 bacterium]|nr:glycosyltransferase [candidate division KSB1 bacterium]
MNLLFLSTENPYPVDGGHHLRTFYVLKLLAKRYNIYFVGFAQDREEFKYTPFIKPFCVSVDMFPVAKTGFNLRFLWLGVKNLFQKQPLIARRYFTRRACSRIEEIIRDTNIDIVHVDMLALGMYARLFRDLPAVLTNHNVESLRLFRWLKHEKNTWKKLFLNLQYKKLKTFERLTCLAFEHCIAVSETDKLYLAKLCQRDHFSIIANGVDSDYFAPIEIETQKKRLIWVGGMTGPYNADAVNFFLREIWPRVTRFSDDIILDIVGAGPTLPALSMAKKDNRIKIYGFVEDIRPFVQRAALFIAPIRSGSGTKLKVLNAMSQAKAVIATSVAAEGIEATDGQEIIIADDPAEFSSKMIYLLQNPAMAERIGLKAREVILKKYDWTVLADDMYKLYERKSVLNYNPVSITRKKWQQKKQLLTPQHK